MVKLFGHPKAERQTPPPKPAPEGAIAEDRPLDHAIDDTFPASDPISAQSPATPGIVDEKAQKDPKHKEEVKPQPGKPGAKP